MKRGGIAAILSALIPGAGQLYNRHFGKGTLFIASSLVLGAELRRHFPVSSYTFGTPVVHSGPLVLIVAALLGISVWSVVDAYRGQNR